MIRALCITLTLAATSAWGDCSDSINVTQNGYTVSGRGDVARSLRIESERGSCFLVKIGPGTLTGTMTILDENSEILGSGQTKTTKDCMRLRDLLGISEDETLTKRIDDLLTCGDRE